MQPTGNTRSKPAQLVMRRARPRWRTLAQVLSGTPGHRTGASGRGDAGWDDFDRRVMALLSRCRDG